MNWNRVNHDTEQKFRDMSFTFLERKVEEGGGKVVGDTFFFLATCVTFCQLDDDDKFSFGLPFYLICFLDLTLGSICGWRKLR